MSKQDYLAVQEKRLAELLEKEHQLKESIAEAGRSIQAKATPLGIAKDVVGDLLPGKAGWGNTAKLALGLGATIVAGNVARKQQKLSLITKALGLAVGLVAGAIAKKKSRGGEEQGTSMT